jgi:hypothetical protein
MRQQVQREKKRNEAENSFEGKLSDTIGCEAGSNKLPDQAVAGDVTSTTPQ